MTAIKFYRGENNRPLFVRDNINSIHTICNTLRFSYAEIALATGIPRTSILAYAAGYELPRKERYNKLAAFFDWEVWT